MYAINHATPLDRFLGLLRRRWLVILGVTAAMVVVATAVSAGKARVYTSQAVLSLGAPLSYDSGLDARDVSEQQLTTQVMTITGTDVTQLAVGMGATGVVSVTPMIRSNAVVITGSGRTPETARKTADAYARAYIEYRGQQAKHSLDLAVAEVEQAISTLDARIAELGSAARGASRSERTALLSQRAGLAAQRTSLQTDLGKMQIRRALATPGVSWIVAPAAPTRPISPQPLRDAGLAGFLGLVLGFGAAVLVDGTRRRSATIRLDELERRNEAALAAVQPMI